MPYFDPNTPFISHFSENAHRSATLPASWYYDPAIFEVERQAIFFSTWQFVGYLDDLANALDYITANLLDQEVFIIRGKDGELRGFHNVCMHRGHVLLEGKGNVGLITCPFHAWTYDATGQLRAAGNAENVAGFEHKAFALTPLRVETFLHMVFINIDDQAPTLASLAGGLENYVREHVLGLDTLHLARRDTIPISANWKFVFDGLECYHCPIIHPEAMKGSDYEKRRGWHESIYSIHTTPGYCTNEEVLFGFDNTNTDNDQLGYVLYLWPNVMFMARRGAPNFAVAHVIPTSLEKCVATIDHFYPNSPPTEENIRSMNGARDVIWPQDTRAMALQQLGVHGLGYREGRLMVDHDDSWRSEHTTHHFDSMVWQAVHGELSDAGEAAPTEKSP